MTSLERRTRCTGRLPTGGRCRPAAGRRDGLGAAALDGRDEGLVPDRPAIGREALVERRLGKPCRIGVMPRTIPAVVPADAMPRFSARLRPISAVHENLVVLDERGATGTLTSDMPTCGQPTGSAPKSRSHPRHARCGPHATAVTSLTGRAPRRDATNL